MGRVRAGSSYSLKELPRARLPVPQSPRLSVVSAAAGVSLKVSPCG